MQRRRLAAKLHQLNFSHGQKAPAETALSEGEGCIEVTAKWEWGVGGERKGNRTGREMGGQAGVLQSPDWQRS